MYAQRGNNAAARNQIHIGGARVIYWLQPSPCNKPAKCKRHPGSRQQAAGSTASKSKSMSKSFDCFGSQSSRIRNQSEYSAEHTLQWEGERQTQYALSSSAQKGDYAYFFRCALNSDAKWPLFRHLHAHKHASCVVSAFIRLAISIATAIEVKHRY